MAKPGRKPKKEIQENIERTKNTILKNIDHQEFNNVSDIDISKLIPNSYNNVVVNLDEDSHQILYLPEDMGKISFDNWLNKSRGGIFSKDVKDYSLNKKYAKYLKLQNDETYIIARVIEDEELEHFSNLGLIDGKIVDKAYMKFKTLSNNKNMSSTDRYIEEKKYNYKELEDNNLEDNIAQEKNENKSLIT